jgi:hypothetical protein
MQTADSFWSQSGELLAVMLVLYPPFMQAAAHVFLPIKVFALLTGVVSAIALYRRIGTQRNSRKLRSRWFLIFNFIGLAGVVILYQAAYYRIDTPNEITKIVQYAAYFFINWNIACMVVLGLLWLARVFADFIKEYMLVRRATKARQFDTVDNRATRLAMLRDVLTVLDRRFSVAVIYILFALVSLIAAVVLFGLLSSTGVLKFVTEGYIKEAEFGGAAAGFLITLIILIKSYNSATKPDVLISGNVFWSDGQVAPNATVFVVGSGLSLTTNQVGHFQIAVPDYNAWTINAELGDATATATVPKSDAAKPVELRLNKAKPQAA